MKRDLVEQVTVISAPSDWNPNIFRFSNVILLAYVKVNNVNFPWIYAYSESTAGRLYISMKEHLKCAPR